MPALPAVRRQAKPLPYFTSDPGDPDRAWARLRLAALPSAVGTARRFAGAQLCHWGMETLADNVLVVTSELVTNSITEVGSVTVPDGYAALYANTPPVIVFQLRLTDRRLLCEVWDPSLNPPVPGQAGDFDETGRGLGLVASLADHWASYPSPAGGKAVIAWWVRIPGGHR
jgi:anti-sigma regulatory factor (Ser/Thr protein kinase)